MDWAGFEKNGCTGNGNREWVVLSVWIKWDLACVSGRSQRINIHVWNEIGMPSIGRLVDGTINCASERGWMTFNFLFSFLFKSSMSFLVSWNVYLLEYFYNTKYWKVNQTKHCAEINIKCAMKNCLCYWIWSLWMSSKPTVSYFNRKMDNRSLNAVGKVRRKRQLWIISE